MKINSYQPIKGQWTHIDNFNEYRKEFSSVSYGDVKPDNNGDCIEIPYCTGSDYSGGTAELSNYRCIKEDFNKYVLPMYGGYGTFGLLISIDDYNNVPELQELFESLDKYPLYNEDDHSQLEQEIIDTAWDSWVWFDLSRLLDDTIEYDQDKLRNAFYTALYNNDDNIYPEFESNSSCYIDLKTLLPYILSEYDK